MQRLKEVDIVTIGFGWTSSIIAAMACKNGFKVVGLERGEFRDTDNYGEIHDEWRYAQMNGLMQDCSKETVTFANHKEQRALPIRKQGCFVIGEGVGGCGTHWNGMSFRFDPYDFSIRTKTKERYGSKKLKDEHGYLLRDWGISYDEMEPYFTRFEWLCGISGDNSPNPFSPKMSKDFPLPPLSSTPILDKFEQSTRSLGLHPYFVPAANCSQAYINEFDCPLTPCQYCGYCERFACEYGAKASPQTCTMPFAIKTGNLEIRTHSNVLEIVHKDGVATGVRYIDTQTLQEYFQPAKVILLGSFALNNVRMLLNSKIGKPYDPISQTGVVGKNFCYQVQGAVGMVFDEQYNLFMGSGSLGKNVDDFNADNFDHTNLDFLHGASLFVLQNGKRPISGASAPLKKKWGLEYKRESAYNFTRATGIYVQGASLPHKENFLTLDETYKDSYGLPLLKIIYNYTEQDINLQRFLVDKAAQIAKAMNPKSFYKSPQLKDFNVVPYNSSHVTGGTIIGQDSGDSVVNNYMQSHDIKNLFVVGASNFSHNSGWNPTSTVGALAFRCAEGVLKFLSGKL